MHWAALFPTTQIATLLLFTDVIFGKNDPSCPTAVIHQNETSGTKYTSCRSKHTLRRIRCSLFYASVICITFLTRESKIYTFFDKKLTNLVFEKIG